MRDDGCNNKSVMDAYDVVRIWARGVCVVQRNVATSLAREVGLKHDLTRDRFSDF